MANAQDRLSERLESYTRFASRRCLGSRRGGPPWLRYAAAASAGLSATAVGESTLAAIVHSGPINEVMQGDKDFPIDMNEDGLFDFQMFNRREFGTTTSFGFTDYWRAAMDGGSNEVALSLRFVTTYSGSTFVLPYVDQLSASQAIPGSLYLDTRQAEIRGHQYVDTLFGGQTEVYLGNFTGNGFAGVRFGISGNNHFGWIQLNVDAFNRRYTIVDWAYETVPETPILAGATASEEQGLDGDYNDDGVVNAADYVVWRNNEGTTNMLPNDPHGGTIGSDQYNTWRDNFGDMLESGSGASASIPEPGTVTLGVLALGAAGIAALRKRSELSRGRA